MRALAVLAVLAACSADLPGAPQLERVEPAYGPLVGGTRVVVVGTGFEDGAPNRVFIAGREAPLASAITDTQLEVVIPPGEQPGDVEILVVNRNGDARATDLFAYSTAPTITAVSPERVVASNPTSVAVTGTGFLDEGAEDVFVLVDGMLAPDVIVESDRTLRFLAPQGIALVRPTIEVITQRGTATLPRAFRYVPGERGGLLLFSGFTTQFATFIDPVDNTRVDIPRVGPAATRFTSVFTDEVGNLWAFDRARRVGRIDPRTQQLVTPVQSQLLVPTMVRANTTYVAIERSSARFGTIDLATLAFTALGSTTATCCGSFGIAFDGTRVWFTMHGGVGIELNTIDLTTGEVGTPIQLVAPSSFSVEDMRFFQGALYATSRDSTIVRIDTSTGIAMQLPVTGGRFNAMEVLD